MVKEDWSLIGEVKEEELLRSTTSGVGGIIQTLFPFSKGKNLTESFGNYKSLDQVLKLDAVFRTEVKDFVYKRTIDNKLVSW